MKHWDEGKIDLINFSINNQEDISFIMEKLLDNKTFKKVNDIYDSEHSYIKLIDKNGVETNISLHQISYNKRNCVYSNYKIQDYIYNIGVEKGMLEPRKNNP